MRAGVIARIAAAVTVVALAGGVFAAEGATPADPNLVAARAAAQRILSVVPLPPGAAPASTDPSTNGTLAKTYVARGTQEVDSDQYWTVSETPGAVTDYIRAHPPAGAHLMSYADPSGSGATYSFQESLSFPGETGKVTSETLQINLAAAADGATAVRADALVLWRPVWDHVPAATAAAWVTLDGAAQRPVTGRALARLRTLINNAPVVAPGAYSCPDGIPGQKVGITIVGAHGRQLAHAGYDSADGCVWLSMSVGGRRGPELQSGWDVTPLLWSAGSLVVCTARQLSVSAGPVTVSRAGGAATMTILNTSHLPCSLRGYPAVQLISPTGRRVTGTRANSGTTQVTTALRHGAVFSGLSWPARGGRCVQPAPSSAAIGLPDIRRRFHVALAPGRHRFGPCSGHFTVSAVSPVG